MRRHAYDTPGTIWLEEYLACLFIRTINQERYGPLKNKLANDWAFGEDSYPKTVAKAFCRKHVF